MNIRELSNCREVAVRQVISAVRRGEIVKASACQECGGDGNGRPIEAHHEDHNYPMEVEWLCTQCHGKRRWGLRRQMGEEMWQQVGAKAKRDGISLRALILGLLKDWLSK